jgi:hypothetical protein
MLNLSRAEVQKREDECTHQRSVTMLPGSGATFFCTDCGHYLSLLSVGPFDDAELHIDKWKNVLLGPDNARRAW